MLIKYIHPKTGTVREVEESYQSKIALLKRAGFIPFAKYRAPKPVVVPYVKNASDVVQDEKQDLEALEEVNAPEVAVHVSASARVLIEEFGVDAALIEGSGKDGQITKPDVKDYLEILEEAKVNLEELTEEEAEIEEEEEEVVYRNQAGDEIPGEEEVPGPSEEEAE